ncbi:hypothetical protein [Devosia sp.]|uniref:hypothetical protein n=1 Tax=Devosia sp. TaxID=1871048 RepID=UPI003F6F3C74
MKFDRVPRFIHTLSQDEAAAIHAANCTTKHILRLAGKSKLETRKALHRDAARVSSRASASCAYEAMRTAKVIDWLIAGASLEGRACRAFIFTPPESELYEGELSIWDPNDECFGVFPFWKRARTRLKRMGAGGHGIASAGLGRFKDDEGFEVYQPMLRGVLWGATEAQVANAFAPLTCDPPGKLVFVPVTGGFGPFLADWKTTSIHDFEWYEEIAQWLPVSLIRTDRFGMRVLREAGCAELRAPMSPKRRQLFRELAAEIAERTSSGGL